MISKRHALLLAIITGTAIYSHAAPELSAQLTSTTLSIDADSDGRADAGDSIHYEGSVANTGDASATSVTVTISGDPELTIDPAAFFSNVIAIDDSFETDEDTPLTVAAPGALANDIDYPLPLSLSVLQSTATNMMGLFAVSENGGLLYDPDGKFENLAAGETATEFVEYAATDAQNNVDTATVAVTINGVNDAPVAVGQSVTTNEDTPLEITLTGTDLDDGAALTFSIVSGPATGSLGTVASASDTSAKVTFTPGSAFQSLAVGQSEQASFTFNVSDGVATAAAATVTITVTGVNDAPVPATETYSATGNTTLEVGGTDGNSGAFVYTRNGSGNVLLNDTDVDDGAVLTAVAETVATTGGGSVTIRANGSFFYVPPVGFTGGNDTFTYKVTDGTATVNQAVTIGVAGKLWYIHNGVAGSSNGTSQNPFTSLASFNTANTGASGKPLDNEFIYLVGTATAYTGGITLRNGQILQGSGVALSREGVTRPAGTTPTIGNSAGAGVTLGSGNTVNSVTVAGTSGPAFSGSSVGALAVTNTTINNTGSNGGALNLTNGTVNVSLGNVVTGTGATNAISLTNINGTVTATGGALANATQTTFFVSGGTANITWPGTITNTSSQSINIANKTAGTVTFSGAVSDTGTGIALSNNTGATINFTGGLSLSTGANTAFSATGGGTVSVSSSAGTLASVRVNAKGSNYTSMPTVTLSGGGGSGATATALGVVSTINLTSGGSGYSTPPTVTISGGGGSGAVATARLSGGTVVGIDVTYGGSGYSSVPTVSISGGGGSGAAGSARLKVGVINLNNTGSGYTSLPSVAFSGGSGSGASASATIAGTSTIVTSTGTALNVVNTNIGSGGLLFRSIATNGAQNPVILNNTGTAGGLRVTGTGTATSGGTITNGLGGGDGAQQGNGLYLIRTANVDLTNTRISNFSNNAIYADDVTGFILDRVVIEGLNGTSNSGAFQESNLHMLRLDGAVSLTNCNFSGAAYNTVMVRNMTNKTNGQPTAINFTVSNCMFGTMQGSTMDVRNSALQLIADVGTATAHFQDNRFTYWWGNASQVIIQGTATGTAKLSNNHVKNTSGALAGSGGLWVAGGALHYEISFNYVQDTNGTAISADKAPALNRFMQGTISNNTIGTPGVANSGSAQGMGIFALHTGLNVTTIKISDNFIRQVNGTQAIWAMCGDDTAGGGAGTFNVTMTNNDIAEEGTNPGNRSGIVLQSGRVTGDTDILNADLSGNKIVNFNSRIRPNQRFNTKMYLAGYSGGTSPGDTAAVNAYFAARNPGTVALSAATTTGGGGYFATVSVPQPAPVNLP